MPSWRNDVHFEVPFRWRVGVGVAGGVIRVWVAGRIRRNGRKRDGAVC